MPASAAERARHRGAQGPPGQGADAGVLAVSNRATVHELLSVVARHAREPSARERAQGMTLRELRDELLGHGALPPLDAGGIAALRGRDWYVAFPKARLVAAVAGETYVVEVDARYGRGRRGAGREVRRAARTQGFQRRWRRRRWW